MRCGLGFQLERARAGQLFDMGGVGNSDMDRAVAALRRAKRVRARLKGMGAADRDVLFAGYCWSKPGGLRALDRLGAVCLLTTAAARAYHRAQLKAAKAARIDVQAAMADDDVAAVDRAVAGLLASPLPRHVTLASWLGPTMKTNDDLKKRVMAEADDMLTMACQAWYMSPNDNPRRPRSLCFGMPGSGEGGLVIGPSDQDPKRRP